MLQQKNNKFSRRLLDYLIKFYVENKLIPFSLTVNYINNKKELIMPKNWVDANINNYNNFINDSNCLAIKMGTSIDTEYKIIGVDIDNKTEENILNGVDKWQEIIKNLNINTMVQTTANKGYHYLFKVTNEQFKNIKNIITLKIENKKYSIDVKANENSFLICEPSKFYDENKNIKKYKWINKENIQIIPDEIYNLIKIKTDDVTAETNINNNVNLNLTSVLLELDIIKPYFYYLSCSRINNLSKWFKLASLIKSIYNDDDALNLILNLSRKSKHYKTDEWIIQRVTEISKKKFTINTFYYWLKKDNPEKYQELFNRIIKTRKTDNKLIETIKIILDNN